MSNVREAFERIALSKFLQPISREIAEDHWQTWQEAWEAAVTAERERLRAEVHAALLAGTFTAPPPPTQAA